MARPAVSRKSKYDLDDVPSIEELTRAYHAPPTVARYMHKFLSEPRRHYGPSLIAYHTIYRLGPLRVYYDRTVGPWGAFGTWVIDGQHMTLSDIYHDLVQDGDSHAKANGNREKLHLGKGV